MHVQGSAIFLWTACRKTVLCVRMRQYYCLECSISCCRSKTLACPRTCGNCMHLSNGFIVHGHDVTVCTQNAATVYSLSPTPPSHMLGLLLKMTPPLAYCRWWSVRTTSWTLALSRQCWHGRGSACRTAPVCQPQSARMTLLTFVRTLCHAWVATWRTKEAVARRKCP